MNKPLEVKIDRHVAIDAAKTLFKARSKDSKFMEFKFELGYEQVVALIAGIIKMFNLEDNLCNAFAKARVWAKGVVKDVEGDIVEVVVEQIIGAIEKLLGLECPTK